MRDIGKTWQHRTIWQEHSAKDFASYESYKRVGILYVFPPFITARMGQKIGRRPQTQLCHIKTLRIRRGMTQDELAEAPYVTRQTVSNYETGVSLR